MRAWIIETGEQIAGIDGDVRDWHCGMLARSLAAKGHEVVLWASTFHHLTKQHRFEATQRRVLAPRLQVNFLHGPGYGRNISLKRVLHNRITADVFSREAASEPKPDVIFCSLPTIELAERATRFACDRKVPIVVDVADLWPDIYVTAFPRWLRGMARLALATEFRRAGRALRMATSLTAVSRSYLDWALRLAGRSARAGDAVFPLGYPQPTASPVEVQAEAERLRRQHGIRAGGLVVTFIGTFGASYDLETVVSAASLLRSTGAADVQIVLAGMGDQAPRLHQLARGLDNVVFTGWLDYVSMLALMSISSVGLAAYRGEALQSLPNKPFEYMASGLSLLSSLSGELETLIRDERIGVQYRAGDAASLAERIRWLAANPEQVAEMGRRAGALFESTFREDVIYPKLVSHLEQVSLAGC